MFRLSRILASTLVLGSALTSSLVAESDWQLLGTRKVSMTRETDVIDVTNREGRFNALRIEVDNGPIEMFNIRVVFANGESFTPTVRLNFDDNDQTRVIDLPGDARSIERIVFNYKGPVRLGAATVRVFGRPVGEGRNENSRNENSRSENNGRINTSTRSPSEDGWTQLGARQVDFRSDHDVIQVEGSRRFNTILLAVEGADVEISNISVNFANGEHYNPEVNLVFQENSRSRFIDLPGDARDIKNIEFTYRTLRRSGNDKAIVHVYGRTRGGSSNGDNRTPAQDGWTEMGARQVDFRSDHDVIKVEGPRRFNTILLAVEGADVEISNISVNFANGEHYDPDVRLLFEENSRSRFIDLPGDARDISDIEFRYRTLKESGNNKAIVHVYGRTRGGAN